MKIDLDNMMQQAKQMQEGLHKAQQELASLEVVGEAGGGMVKVRMNGKREVGQVEIEAAVLTEDKAMVEDLVAAAMNDALRAVESLLAEKMQGSLGGLPLPAGFKFPL